jgi:REP element-mobilizing transposase RayT
MAVRVNRAKAQAAWSFPKPKAKNRGGRPRITHRRASERHEKRKPIPPGTPVHVTMRIEKAVGYMRKRDRYRAIRRATLQAFAKELIRIVHLTIQGDHLHAIVEATSSKNLALGMKGFQISAARHVNRACGRRGRVFADRYHVEYLRNPKMVRNAIAYVINNWRKHGEDRGSVVSIDPFSSAASFTNWKVPPQVVPLDEPLAVSRPSFWLLSEGWTRHGLIDPDEVPGPRSSIARA